MSCEVIRPHQVVAGVDPSLTSTGLAIDWKAGITTHRIRSSGKADATWDQRAERLENLTRQILDEVPAGALVIMEGPSYASAGAGAHDRAGFWWQLYQGFRSRGSTIVPVSPAQRMMYATGKGGGKDAGKDNVLAAAIKTYPDLNITGNDIADAVLFVAIGRRLLGHPIEKHLPATRLNAMSKISLPGDPA